MRIRVPARFQEDLKLGLFQAEIEQKVMITAVLEELDHRLELGSAEELPEDKKWSEWVFAVPKELYRRVIAKCMEHHVNQKNALRHELFLYAVKLHREGHLKHPPNWPEGTS